MKKEQFPISNYIVNVLLDNQIINIDQKSLYLYCINGILEYMLFAFTMLIISLYFNMLLSGILILIMLALIKSFSGGVHAPNGVICFICSISSFLAILILSVQDYIRHYFSHPLTVTPFLVILFILSPVASPNKPLSSIKRKLFRKKVIINSLVFIALDFILYYSKHVMFCCNINLTIGVITISVLTGHIIYNKGSYHERH